jgi:DNA primase
MSAIDEVKQKIDIVEVIGQYTALKKAGRNLTALCPFHSEKLANRVGVTLPSRERLEERREEKEEFIKVNEAAALYYHNLLINSAAAARAKSYLEKRGLTPQTIADFQLGYAPDSWDALKNYLKEKGHSEETTTTAGLLIKGEDGRTYDRFRGKLIIPIGDIKGRVTGFGARVLDDSLPKYINSPQSPTFDKSSTLYGIDRAAATIRKQDRAIIMEGYMDVIMAHQGGVTNAVASMGTAITETQVNALKKLTRNLVLSLDADAAGEEAMLRTVIYENTLNAEMRVIILPEGKDPDEVIKADVGQWRDLVKNAVPLIDFMFQKTIAGLDLKTAKNKSFIIEKLLPIIANIKEHTRKVHYIEKLARLLDERVNDIQASLSELKQPVKKQINSTTKQKLNTKTPKALLSSFKEEYCLALLLQHPQLREQMDAVAPEYFESSENRVIFNAYKEAPDVVSLKERVDPAVHEHLDAIANKTIPSARNNIEQKFIDCAQELKKRYLKNLAARKSESGDEKDDNTRLEEDLEISRQLKELDARRKQHRSSFRGTRS